MEHINSGTIENKKNSIFTKLRQNLHIEPRPMSIPISINNGVDTDIISKLRHVKLDHTKYI